MKKIFAVSIICILLIFGLFFGAGWLIPKVKEEQTNSAQISIEDFFEEKGHFYVYFYRDDCRYCENIEVDINEFAVDNVVHKVDSELCKGLQSYDWDEHELMYDIEIGEKNNAGELIFYDGKTESEIMGLYDSLDYKIVLANERYAELHEGKEADKIYAVLTHPVLKEEELCEENFVLPAIPMLVEFEDHQVLNYYFDDKEIINYLGSDTKPLDAYWNLE